MNNRCVDLIQMLYDIANCPINRRVCISGSCINLVHRKLFALYERGAHVSGSRLFYTEHA